MLRRHLFDWYRLFTGVAVYHPLPSGGHDDGTWLTLDDLVQNMARRADKFGGEPIDPKNQEQRDRIEEAIVSWAGTLRHVGLVEGRRSMAPLELYYRLTPFGRRVERWRGKNYAPTWKARTMFAVLAVYLRGRNLWPRVSWVVKLGAFGWAAVNALRFYGLILTGIAHTAVAVASAVLFLVVVLGVAWLRRD